RYTALYYKFLSDDVEQLSESKSEDKKVSGRLKWIAYKDKFFSTVMIADEGFESATFDSKMVEADGIVKEFKTTTAVPFDLRGNEATTFRYFFGPNSYPLLKSYDKGVASDQQLDLERLVPLGASVFRWVNQYFVIPMFDFLGKYIKSYGLIILLMTIIVKLILFPLTYKSYMSSAKMRVLRPQVEELNAKYPGQDKAVERQRATMELYSRAGASPMAGCIPMLLQMPILIALFMFFPSAIELRHQSFLWAHDLSTYDAIFSWNKYIPIITPYFGNHISLFCLLMTITNVIYTKYNMEMTNTGQQQMPGMKAMMYMMPLMFLVFFNQYASGLTYYYFISTLITIVQTLVFRYTINEDKLLAKLEANKKKPQKKSGFMKRLEEAQRMQQEQLKKQQDQKKKR
ncbi:membrane protein insertase YidC, partial [Parabacteroides goldsteinii]